MKSSALLVILCVILTVAGALAAWQLRAGITIEIGGQTQNAVVWGWTVADALADAGILINEGDVVTPELGDRIPKNQPIRIEQASWVLITADGESQPLWTAVKSPARLLETAGFTLGPADVLLWNGTPLDPQTPLPSAQTHSLQILRAATLTLQGETFESTAATLGAALWERGFTIHNGDQLEPAFETPLRGQEIAANLRTSQRVIIQQSDTEIEASVIADTVGDALAQAGVSLQGLDYSIPDEFAPLPISRVIRVVRITEEVILETEPLSFGFLTQPLPEVELDTQQVVQVGEFGLKASRVRVQYEDGVEVARQTEAEWVAREPKPRIVGYGTQINIRTLDTPGGPLEYWRVVDVYASTYSPCHSGGDRCYPNTSSGKPVQKGVIAVTLPWYRSMQGLPAYVPNYGFGTIEDVGGGLPDRHWIDLGYSDADWVGWGGWTKIYFLTPVPETIMWILE